LAEVIIAPAAVQGEEAVPSLINALKRLDHEVKPDVIILARGGGSIEDLWAFNDENLVRVIADLETPIVTGIGHETDITLADYASDLRAPTPTAAAEMVTPNLVDLQAGVQTLSQRLQNATLNWLNTNRLHLRQLTHRLNISSPANRVNIARQRLDEMMHRLELHLSHTLQQQRSKVELYFHRLESLNPQALLERGYSILTKKDGIIVRSIEDVTLGETVQARLKDGHLDTRVESILH